MIDSLDLLRQHTLLRRLLFHYKACVQDSPDAQWFDRLMALEGADSKELSKMHGLLLANGWLDTRVQFESIATPGRLADCYRPTREGLLALRLIDDFVSAEIDEPVIEWNSSE